MRGTGAVIHFRPPTDSSMPSPDLSGRWNSIRDWFSLPVQDEAAQCFRVFYQPNEATSPSDRLFPLMTATVTGGVQSTREPIWRRLPYWAPTPAACWTAKRYGVNMKKSMAGKPVIIILPHEARNAWCPPGRKEISSA